MPFDTHHVRHAFSRAAATYDDAADLQREVAARLAESLPHYALSADRQGATPAVVLDVGSGTGAMAAHAQALWPRARVLALDLALPMLARHPRATIVDTLRRRARPQPLCADARALPIADGCVDVLVSSLCLQWVEDLPAVLAGFRRVLRPGGLLLFSTFGPDTLHELREAFGGDETPHVSAFAPMAAVGDALVAGGWRDPVLDRDLFVRGHADLPALMRELRALGATNANRERRRTLTGRARFARAAAAYEPLRRDGLLPSTWDVVYAQAWAPAHGTPLRVGGVDEVRIPATAIPVRTRAP